MLATVLGCDCLRAAVVVNSNIILDDMAAGADYALTIFQDEAGTDETTIWFDRAADGTLSVVTFNVDESSDWFLTSEFDEFSDINIIGGSFPVLLVSTPTGFEIGDIDAGLGDFFLGVNTGNSDDPGGGFPPRNVFGWVHLRNNFGTLAMVENAVSYQGRGIIIGTTQVIPEPSVAHVAIVGLLMALAGRRRSRK